MPPEEFSIQNTPYSPVIHCLAKQHDYVVEKTLIEETNQHDAIKTKSFNYFLYCRKCGQVTGHGRI